MTYVGATRLIDPTAGLALGPMWAWQPKMDGCYARATLDSTGRIASVVSRTGRAVPEAADLIGLVAGPPDSVIVGELDAHTEAGVGAYRRQGYRRLHLFDCLRLAGDDLRARPYVERWGALHRGQSAVEAEGLGRVDSWATDTRRRAHATDSGRYVRRVPADLRLMPIVPLLRSRADAGEMWREVEAGQLEGLVAVRLDARAAAPGSKLKIKVTDTIDARVVAVGSGCVEVATRSGSTHQAWRSRPTFTVASVPGAALGAVLEISHHGYYASGEPRFARAVRARADIRQPG